MAGFTKTEFIWMNGALRPWAEAQVHITAHGLHYGTGVFEGMRSYDTPDGPAIFRTFGATWRFTPEGASRSRITFQYSFTLKRWTLPPISHRIAEWIFRRDMRKRIEALRRYAEQRLTIGGQS